MMLGERERVGEGAWPTEGPGFLGGAREEVLATGLAFLAT